MDLLHHPKLEMNCKILEPNLSVMLRDHGYKIGKYFGEGSYSKVYEAHKFYPNGNFIRVACKVINRRKASKEYVEKFLPRELEILKQLSHTNLVHVYDILETSNQVLIFMELCPTGDLLDYITKKGHLSEYRTRHLFHQIVTAVQYIHSNDLSHRDLKCENILLKDELTVRITDFGFARSCRDKYTNQRILSDTFCGSAAYAAPEILQGLPYNPKMYDVWSLGCILYIMLTARMPYDDSNITKMLYVQLHAILTFPTKPEFKISHDMKKFIKHLLEPDVTKRATINQVYTELAQLPPITHKNCVNPKHSVQKLTGNKTIGQSEMDYLRMKLKKCKIPHNF